MKQEFIESVKHVLATANESVEFFRTGDEAKGYNKIVELIERIQIFITKLSGLNISQEDMQKYVLNINNILIELSNALVNRDGVLISDILEYELIPTIEPLNV